MSSNTEQNASQDEAPVKKKSPLEMKKELQAKMQSNRAAKEKRPDPSAQAKGGVKGDAPVAKPMRSSASKQGG
jgi:hypothetical protein